jgi:hypothetical protein
MDDRSDQARRWRERAEVMRTVAESTQDKTMRTSLMIAAANWESMATNAERSVATASAKPEERLRRKTTIVTCRCGARYQRKMVQSGARVRDTFDCFVCDAPIEIWKSPLSPPFVLVSRPDRASGQEK